MIGAVRTWVAERAPDCKAPVLEVGSYDVNGTIRDLFPEPYTGLDMREGPGVDVVGDVNAHQFERRSFATIISVETLEHVREPWHAVARMASWLKKDGLMLVSVPFSWEYHAHPNDYWRMTHEGLRFLFERAGLDVVECETQDNTTFGMARKR